LRPKKAKDFIPQVAKDLHLAEKLIEDVVDFYWQEVRKSLSSLKHSRIHITNLGDFTIKHWKIDEKIKQLEHWEETNKQKGLQQITARFKTAETLFDLKTLNAIIEKENQRKDFIKLHKINHHGSESKHIQDLET